MDTDLSTRITHLLTRIETGDSMAVDDLFPLIYDELRRQAARYLRDERKSHTLQATALVHEAYVKLAEQTGLALRDDVHIKAVSARAMRQILVDHARARRTAKRGGGEFRLAFDEDMDSPDRSDEASLVEIDDALKVLTDLNERKGRVAELRLFGELTHREVGEALGISPKTAESDWYFARAWLRTELKSK